MEKTKNDLIHIGKPIKFDVEKFIDSLVTLDNVSKTNSEKIIKEVEKVVKTFHPVGNKPTGLENKDSKEFKKQKEMMKE